jgi:hypothetical protein
MLKNVSVLTSVAALLAGITACSSAPTPAAKTAATRADTHAVSPTSAPAKQEPAAAPLAGNATTSPPAAEEPDPRADGLRKASRPPAELITGPNLVYVFNFKESEAGIAAKKRCSDESEDRSAVAACLEKARGKVPVELIRFIKEPNGDLWWVTYNRYKGNLLKWHRVQFQPGEEGADRITLNLIGKDKGIAPMARVPRHLEIELPNDYSIVVKDPENGTMFYDAKVGTMQVD